jgi:hypothetical protein
MRVRFFVETLWQQTFDQRQVYFTLTPDLPAPPLAFLMEHFGQAVLANMKGAGKVQVYDIDPSEDSQTRSIFETGEGKEYLENFLMDKLHSPESPNDRSVEVK